MSSLPPAYTEDDPSCLCLNMQTHEMDKGILVKDGSCKAYIMSNTTFNVGMLDFTHPEAGSWFKKILHDMVDFWVRGWMADFSEGLPPDAKLFSGLQTHQFISFDESIGLLQYEFSYFMCDLLLLLQH